jgi:SOS-response transcriptional repressor LexA
MPALVASTQFARYSLVQAELPGWGLTNLGVLLEDPETNSVHLRFRRDMESIAGEEDDWFLELAGDLSAKASEMGAGKLFAYLEDTLSGSVLVSDRQPVMVEDFSRSLDRLYRQHVESNVLQFRTHLPRYSLQVAAGKFLENEEVTGQDWIETPEDLRLTVDMFIATIAGHSMEPLIPDGSLCVFRGGIVAGSRKGRLVLVEQLGATGENQYTVKRYQSETASGEEGWRHSSIRLEALNPDYPDIALNADEEKYRVIAEFVRVLE